jgi:hypothetical protein
VNRSKSLVLGCCLVAACAGGATDDHATDDGATDDATHPELREDVGDLAPSDVRALQAELDAPTAGEPGTIMVTPEPLLLFVAPDGDDHGDGSAQQPLATLIGAQERLRQIYPSGPLDRNVEVRIAPGIYDAPQVRWDFPSAGHSITFMPRDYQVGMGFDQVKALGGRPVFDGQEACEARAAGQACKFFVVDQPVSSGPTRLRFYYLDIRNFATTGIGLHNGGEGLNLVFGCRFANIGTYRPSFRELLHGMAAVGLGDSDHNVVQNNHFVNIRNQAGEERFIHAVYMNVRSDRNRIVNNRTFRVSGDPIKVRQFSNHNLVRGNTLRCSGQRAFVLDYPEDFPATSGRQDECASWENHVESNTLDCGYDGAWLRITYPEPGRRCGAPKTWRRFRASGNSNACTASCW